jgi:hypothetical protein
MKKTFTYSILFVLLSLWWNSSVAQLVPVVYDDCTAAVSLQPIVGTSCTGVFDFQMEISTASPGGTIPVPACGGFTDGITNDVWFRFTSGNMPGYQVNINPGSSDPASDLAMAVYTGGCVGPWTLLACDDNSNGSGMPSLGVNSAAAGTEYFVRVWAINGSACCSFKICVAGNLTSAVEEDLAKAVMVYPIPFEQSLTVSIPPASGKCLLRVRNMLGEVVLAKEDALPETVLNTASLPKGIYVLEINSESFSASKKIVRM